MRTLMCIAAVMLAVPLAADEKPPCCRELAPAASDTDKSLYQLESVWTSDVGRQVKLGVLRGRPQVLALFFTGCEYACPITVHTMQNLEKALPERLRGQAGFLLVSLDSERDSRETLRAYREQQRLSPARWTLLRGSHDDVRELAALLGVNYQRDARGQFAHTNLITVLNVEGEIIHQQTGLNADPRTTLTALENAAALAR